MSVRGLAAVAIAGVVLAGCTTYSIAGYFENTEEPFSGTVTVSLGDSGSIKVATDSGSLSCTGTSQIVERPSGFVRVGGRAEAEATCSDGRKFKVEVIQDHESGGSGEGVDDRGNIVHVYFDDSATVARSEAQKGRLQQRRAAAMAQQAAPAAPRPVAERLLELQGLLDKKLISEEEFQARRKVILENL
jgi:hypothetical protein